MHTRPSSLPPHVIHLFLPLSFSLSSSQSFCSARLFPSFPRATTQTRDEKIEQRRLLGPDGTIRAGGWVREANGTDRLSLPVSEIKRRGRNLAEGCKYYKVTLRRMRELLKGSPQEEEERALGGQCERVSEHGAFKRVGNVNYVRKGDSRHRSIGSP